MQWDENSGSLTYFGKVPIDTASPIRVGEKAKLTQGDHYFEVKILDIVGEELKGEVLLIGEIPLLEALGIKRGDVVTFRESNIKILYRKNA